MFRRTLIPLLLISSLPLLLVASAHGDITFSAFQSGNDVVVTGEGSIDLAGLGTPGTLQRPGRLQANEFVLIGPGLMNATFDTYEVAGATGPANIGSGVSTFNADLGTGDILGYDFAFNTIALPDGYASGDSLLGSITFQNQSLNTLGLTAGNYQWTVGSNLISVNISAVPEPSSILFCSAFALLLPLKRKRNPKCHLVR